MRRRVQPVPASCPLHLLAPLLRPARTVGVWVATSSPPLGPARRAVHRAARLFISADLASLLARVERVVAWDGTRLRLLPVGCAAPVDHPAEVPVG